MYTPNFGTNYLTMILQDTIDFQGMSWEGLTDESHKEEDPVWEQTQQTQPTGTILPTSLVSGSRCKSPIETRPTELDDAKTDPGQDKKGHKQGHISDPHQELCPGSTDVDGIDIQWFRMCRKMYCFPQLSLLG